MRFAFGEYQLDTEARSLQRSGQAVHVEPKVFDLLAYLIENRGRVASTDELLDALWPEVHVGPAALSNAVRKLREAVGDDGERQAVLQTEHGRGFRFVAEVTDLSPPETAGSESAEVARMPILAELKRRNVFRVAAAYAIVAWLLVEVASVVLPTFKAPEWVMQVFTFLVILGFPLALIFAWAFELTPGGIKRESAVDPAESITHLTGRKLDFAIIGLLALAVVFLVVNHYFLPPPEREKSIAVLPFANRSANEEDAFFVDGMHDDIVTHLSKIRSLKVISRTSVMAYRNRTKNLKTIGQELGVATVLEGGVQRAGDQIRVSVQLIDAETDDHLWADTYDRELTTANVFAIQTEIATAIADALRATLSPEERARLATVPTENLAAYKAYLLGRQRLARETTAALGEAVDYFQQAIELDPGFALAYVGLAETYVTQVWWTGLAWEERLAKAQAAADKALALDDQLGEAYNSLAGIKEERGDIEGAEAMYRRALELNPNYVMAYNWYGYILRAYLGRYEEALALHRKAAELDPLSVGIILEVGADLESLGRFDEALARYQRALEVDPGHAAAYYYIGDYYRSVSGRLDEAVVWRAKGIRLDPGNPGNYAFLGTYFLDLGDFDRAEYWIERSLELGPEILYSNLAMQALHLYRGDEAAALDYARRVFELWPSFVPGLLRDHELRAGRYAEARALYEESYPELLNERDPTVDGSNRWAAIHLALVLAKSGEQDRADLLLSRSLQYIQTVPRRGEAGYGIADVQIYALQGEKQKALSALRQAIDEGWRGSWRYSLESWQYSLKYNSALESLHDEPEFQAMVAEIEADMAAQLARVREMERNGELAAIPRGETNLH
jgi:TolB-like protein/DNA-binding winged helix-turn-helix (wHTH) protein/Tfp pilus assembly protein PilF